MKAWSIARNITVALAVLAFPCADAEAAVAQTPIGAHQHFAGMVNGEEGRAVVYTVCPGPASGHRFGAVKKGQTVAVAEAAAGPGYTGLFSRIYVWFEPIRARTRPVTLSFSQYAKPRDIPRSVRVPCTGKGKAVFSSCPYLAPCAAGFVQDTLKVRFENIAARPARSSRPQHRSG